MAFTYEGADNLRAELEGYDAEAVLIDGLTAADSLRSVLHAPKEWGEPRIVFDGRDYAQRLRNEEAQYPLFETA